jgi:hypothetical protein
VPPTPPLLNPTAAAAHAATRRGAARPCPPAPPRPAPPRGRCWPRSLRHTLGGRRIPPFLHADDPALIATTRDGLQTQLDALAAFSARWGLTVNLSKTKVMNLGGDGARAQLVRATYNCGPLAQVPAFNYLSITFKEGEPLGASAPAARLRPAGKALGAIRGSCARAGPLPPDMQVEVGRARAAGAP